MFRALILEKTGDVATARVADLEESILPAADEIGRAHV